MSIEVKMPALSPTMTEGTLAKWLVKEGDAVKAGDILAEIETDKAIMEFETVDAGIIAKILVPEGSENIAVGQVIAVMAEAGEDVSQVAASASSQISEPSEKADVAQKETADSETISIDASLDKAISNAGYGNKTENMTASYQEKAGRIKASPLAKRLAKKNHVDLKQVNGSGPHGRIIKADIEAFVAEANQASSNPSVSTPEASGKITHDTPHNSIKLSNMRRVIARRLTESKQNIPHIYLTVDVQMDALLKLRSELNESLAVQNIKISVNDMLIKAQALALKATPNVNVAFDGDQMLQFSQADISVAVSVEGGLITPILKQADTKSLSALSVEMKELIARAREGRLQPQEYQGGTSSISNMGMFGIKQFNAVINPPQASILAIGSGERRPWVIDDAITIATVATITGSFDHRVIDGADAAAFMSAFKHLVEKPLGILAQ
ncbi:MAG: pyruvate dehydrogenase complex dihydrolipoamide acetyltransferase [Zymomonas mobilis]|uniref:Acetyltransferase component of pyruvate dehydrogenase complex n=1 Tax=Zymomonas mobilis subsp. mobilis (strain ATCC 10988 / DSM 424 / LMG 404 / NCIMB 8938 / NRRL B-806 / ZM1) TaxID=555217 RepID=A0A0H3G2D8_ZYMMA|nr:pyruvate dehydrogenase complex dihydrolipoamide acetyltransferase [Zymomonas mobilis]ACV75292.1 pyruvate dehydrogenase complex dihydrolipoamide acetyltransferase [Zymomonas mobilis subsp. mobilis NCIMB 11163]AEH62869.1 pyruvate dehydrogenase complex dihydrolipoamide acetyltransferase [Zymomonas mobilis subsp. mobilis ATCC 10988]AHB10078.1 pyruvate dehydrogenase complex dihydrolipoamide acetyltransferase, long form [Zymomonas mobilis subsp. mobilis str. CP4 = NRRL B-14023]AHJ70384.1 Dihydroli